MHTTKDIVSRFAELPEDQRQAVVADALQATAEMKWLPLPGPQTKAYFSQADILLYGGAAGGSKSDCGLGLAFTSHQHALMCRRQYTDLGALIKRALDINGTRIGFNGAPPAKPPSAARPATAPVPWSPPIAATPCWCSTASE